MKKIKKLLIIMMVMVSLTTNVAYGATNAESYAGNQLRTIGILNGYEDGSLKLDNPITRAEVAALAIRIIGYDGVSVSGEPIAFTDVAKTHWAYGVIQNASILKLIQGYPDKKFKPKSEITYAEVVAIMVNALGEQTNLVGEWPNNYLDKAKSLGVIPKTSVIDSKKIMTRGEMSVIIWDTLLVKK